MKKFYATLALAALVCSSASALDYNKAELQKADQPVSQNLVKVEIDKDNNVRKAAGPAKKISSAKDLEGFYTLAYYSYLSNSEGEHYDIMRIVAGSDANHVQIDQFMGYPGTLEMEVNVEKQTVTIYSEKDWWYNDYYNKSTDLELQRWNDNGQGRNAVDKLTANILEDGTISFDWQSIITNTITNATDPNTGETASGFFFFISTGGDVDNLAFTSYDMWEFNAAEWSKAGKAAFTDGWLAPCFGMNVPGGEPYTYNVDYYVNKDNENLILLANPYGEGTIWTDSEFMSQANANQFYNTSTVGGFIYIDATNPDIVCVKGPVYSGYTSEELDDFYCWNQEGMFRFNDGYDDETIEAFMSYYDMETSYMDGNDIVIYNCLFGCNGAFNGLYSWQDSNKNAIEMTSRITLDRSGVESVNISDNAPVKYFNLQGVEIANPEKGQLVIKTQGNKTNKYIAR